MRKPVYFLSICVLALSGCSAAGLARSPLIVEEHILSTPPDLSTDRLVFHFADGNQEKALASTVRYRDTWAQANEHNRRVLEPFGYILRIHQKSENGISHGAIDIYRGDQLIARDVIGMQPLSLNASETAFLGLVDLSDGTYLFTRDRFEMRSWPPAREPYAYVGDRLLYVELTDVSHGVSRLQVYLDDQPAFDGQFNNVSTYASFDGPWTYGNHWALVLLDAKMDALQGPQPLHRLIQDGHDVNSLNGYEQSFQFAVLGGKPFYFYQKDGKVGISFDGREMAQGYDEIPHYECCTGALLNPWHSMNMVWFFARRGAAWYYVEAYVPARP